MRDAARLHAGWLYPTTFGCLLVSTVCFSFYIVFQLHVVVQTLAINAVFCIGVAALSSCGGCAPLPAVSDFFSFLLNHLQIFLISTF